MHNILASIYDNNLNEIRQIIENPLIDPWVRGAAMRTLLVLVKEKVLDRSFVIGYFKQLFSLPSFTDNEISMAELVGKCYDLYPEETYDEIRKSYNKGLVDQGVIGLKEINVQLALGKELVLAELYADNKFVDADDVIERLQTFDSFEDPRERINSILQEFRDRELEKNMYEEPDLDIDGGYHDVVTFQRDTPKAGRTDPCPCGSGKKHKKCCLLN